MTNNVKAFLTDVNRDGFHEVAEAILASGGKDAEHISYDNTESGLAGDNVQAAIDEVAGDVGDLVTAVNGISGDVDNLETAVGGISGDVSDLQTAVSGKVSKSGDTMTGKLTVNNDVEITGDLYAPFANIATLNYHDVLTEKNLNVIPPSAISTGGTLQFPDKGGTLATMSDILDSADEITFDNTGTSLSSNNVEGAIKEVDGNRKSAIINNGITTTIKTSSGAVNMLVIARGANTVVLVVDFWSAGYRIVNDNGAMPSGITVTKNATSTDITISNNSGSAIGYLLI